MGSVIGKYFKVSTWGESHGKAVGVVVDGCPAGLMLSEADIQPMLDRRRPGSTEYGTKRGEPDKVEILSGVFGGLTTGAPISMVVYNKDNRAKDYDDIKNIYRPGHADYTFETKYSVRDYRGGGRSSGRETVSRVAAGAIAKKIIEELGIKIMAYTFSINEIEIDRRNIDFDEINQVNMPDKEAAIGAMELLGEAIKNNDSLGGVVECVIKNLPAGIGEPVFDKLDANLAKAMFSIGGVKGFEVGRGFEAAKISGSENNDSFYYDENKKLKKSSNNSGGVLGGISDGFDVTMRVAFKPTPSIFKTQDTVTNSKINSKINIRGRHDPAIVPRAVAVVEAMASLTVVDLVFANLFCRMDKIKSFYID